MLVAVVCIGVITVDREGIWPEHTTGETVVFAEINESLGSAAASAVPDTTAGQVFRAVRDVMTEQQLSQFSE